jgi:hypothetical protein
VLFNPTVGITAHDDHSGVAPHAEDRLVTMRAMWGTDEVVGLFAPSMTGDGAFDLAVAATS